MNLSRDPALTCEETQSTELASVHPRESHLKIRMVLPRWRYPIGECFLNRNRKVLAIEIKVPAQREDVKEVFHAAIELSEFDHRLDGIVRPREQVNVAGRSRLGRAPNREHECTL